MARGRLGRGSEPYDLIIASFYLGSDFTPDGTTIPGPTEVHRRAVELPPHGLTLQDLRRWWYPVNQWLETWSHTYVAAERDPRRGQARRCRSSSSPPSSSCSTPTDPSWCGRAVVRGRVRPGPARLGLPAGD